MTEGTIEKKLWLIDREIKAQSKRLDALHKAILNLEKDIIIKKRSKNIE